MSQGTKRIAKCKVCFQRCRQTMTDLGWKCKNCLHHQSAGELYEMGGELDVIAENARFVSRVRNRLS